MSSVLIRQPRIRYLRHRKLRGLIRGAEGTKDSPRLKRAAAWFDDQAAKFDTTGAGQTFTVSAAGVAASGVLTLTGNAVDAETATIDTKVYTFEDTLTDVDGNVSIGASASDTIDNLIAAMNLTARQVAATGILTLTGNALDTETVTIGATVYTFLTSLVDAADNVLIGATASDSIDNLIAAVTAGAGAGTLYGTGTTANASATAVAGAGDTMDITASTSGLAGNSVDSTETLTNGSFGGATLSGGLDLYAALMTVHPTVSGAAGAGDTLDATARSTGVAGNLIATTETMTAGSFGAATLASGVEGEGLTISTHGRASGDGPFLTTSSTTLPAGLDATTQYFLRSANADTLTLHRTKKEAINNSNPVDITDAGTGTHTLTPDERSEAVQSLLRQGVQPETITAATDIDVLI